MLRPRAITVKPIENYKLLLEFNNGEERIFDVTNKMDHIFYKSLKDINVFRTVHTNGITVEWDGEIDICPDELYFDSILVEKLGLTS